MNNERGTAMWEKLGNFWAVFKAGEAVANPTAWKRGQITVAMLVTLGGAVLALLHTFGVQFDMSPDQLATIFGGVLTVVGLFNHASTVASTDKVNLLGMAPAGEGDAPPAGAEAAARSIDAGPAASLQREPQATARPDVADPYINARNSGG